MSATTGNAFTKKYLSELIDEKITQLESLDNRTSDEALYNQWMQENNHHSAKYRIEEATTRLGEAVSALEAYEQDSSRENYDAMHRATERLSNRVYEVPGLPHSKEEVSALHSRIMKTRQAHGFVPNSLLIDRLKRVRKYIDESPSEEFSLTLMRTLGFIDIIKTAIN